MVNILIVMSFGSTGFGFHHYMLPNINVVCWEICRRLVITLRVGQSLRWKRRWGRGSSVTMTLRVRIRGWPLGVHLITDHVHSDSPLAFLQTFFSLHFTDSVKVQCCIFSITILRIQRWTPVLVARRQSISIDLILLYDVTLDSASLWPRPVVVVITLICFHLTSWKRLFDWCICHWHGVLWIDLLSVFASDSNEKTGLPSVFRAGLFWSVRVRWVLIWIVPPGVVWTDLVTRPGHYWWRLGPWLFASVHSTLLLCHTCTGRNDKISGIMKK